MTQENENQTYLKLAKWITLVTACIYVFPYVFHGHYVYIRLHDTLEGEWIWFKTLVDSHTAFSFKANVVVPQVMKGLPRSVYPTGLNFNLVLVYFFGLFRAYLISNLLIRVIGFIGMVMLLRSYFLRERQNQFIVILIALTFSVLPVFPPFGLSVLGQPLLLWALFNLHFDKRLIVSYLIIALFPFYSSIVWMMVPVVVFMTGAAVYFYYRGTLNKHFVFGTILLFAAFVVVNFAIVSSMFIKSDFIPHRVAYDLYMFQKPDLVGALTDLGLLLLVTHYHVADFVPVVCIVAMALVMRRSTPFLIILAVSIAAICLFQSFYSYPEYWLSNKIALVKSFRFNRFIILLPFLWLLAFAVSLKKMKDSPVFKSLVLPFLLIQLAIALIGNDELIHNYRMLTGHQKFPGHENYVASNQFEEIKKYIGQPVDSFWVASFGISPSIAQYNGFYTLDGLMSVYDLRYKQQFRKIFEGEIDKSQDIKQYFDGWGNRCYIFSSELGILHPAYNCSKFAPCSVSHFDFNAKAFADLGGKYLISGVDIKNHDAVGLHLEKVFRDEDSWWIIYLYSVKPSS